MSLTWLLLGAVIGMVDGLGKGRGVEILCMMIAGMIVLPIAGVFLGMIGGDPRGSVAGAAGGLLGCCAANLTGVAAIQPQCMSTIVIFGALVGATGFLFLHFLLWKYAMIFRLIGGLIGFSPIACRSSAWSGLLSIVDRVPGANSRFRNALPPGFPLIGVGAPGMPRDRL